MSEAKIKRPGRVKSAILNWLGFGLTDVAQWRELYGRESDAGVRVTEESAMRLSTVRRCVTLISQTIATLPIGLYERTSSGGRNEIRGHRLARMLGKKPNDDMIAVVFWEAVVASMLLQRGAHIRKRMLGQTLVALDFVHPSRIVRRDDEWIITGARGAIERVPLAEVLFIPAFSTDGKTGRSVIEDGVEVFGAALAATKAANRTFKNGLLPTTYFAMERVLTKEQRTEFRENLKEITGAVNAGKSPLLEGGMSVATIGINPNDAQLLESRQLSAEEICSIFGVPPEMAGRGDKASSWASASESANRWLLQYALRPWIKRIEESIWAGLLTPAEQATMYAEFSLEGLLRADTAGRASFYSTALQNGWMSRNEVRSLENLPAVPGGDIYTAQSNLLPLAQLGAGADSNAVRAALIHWLREPEASQ
jgi:HK97 family phage portal protein